MYCIVFRTLFSEFHSLSSHQNDWRLRKSQELSLKIQKHFHDLQNPRNCSNAKTLICDINKSCGFGCQMHHVMYCFIESFFQNRTMILESINWSYDSRGFETYFLPLSETCSGESFPNAYNWNGK